MKNAKFEKKCARIVPATKSSAKFGNLAISLEQSEKLLLEEYIDQYGEKDGIISWLYHSNLEGLRIKVS